MGAKRWMMAVAICALLTGSAWASGAEHCPATDGTPGVYLIGSSTMGTVLGPMLQGELKRRWGIEAKRWGKASSGLARPDFHDWPKETPRLMRRHKPDIVIVSLGTNDNQPLKEGRRWVNMDRPEWKTIYAARVREMLEHASGEDRSRTVLWMGPTSFNGRNARRQGPIINKIMREQVEAFDGPAVFVDAFAATRSGGRPIQKFRQPGKRGLQAARTGDGIHLTAEAVRWLLAEPLLKLVGACIDGGDEDVADAGDDAAGAPTAGGDGVDEAPDTPQVKVVPLQVDDGDAPEAAPEAPGDAAPAEGEAGG